MTNYWTEACVEVECRDKEEYDFLTGCLKLTPSSLSKYKQRQREGKISCIEHNVPENFPAYIHWLLEDNLHLLYCCNCDDFWNADDTKFRVIAFEPKDAEQAFKLGRTVAVQLEFDEGGDAYALASVLSMFLKKFRPKECIGFGITWGCDRLVPDASGGAAIFVTATGFEVYNTTMWLEEQIQAWKDDRAKDMPEETPATDQDSAAGVQD